MNIYPLIFLFIFFLFRYTWSLIGGKRKNRKVKHDIIIPRKVIEIFVYLLIPVSLSFNFIPGLNIFSSNQYIVFTIGFILATFGLFFLIWTRVSRKKDWGLMGDESADKLAKNGAYSVSRHPYYIGGIFLLLGIYLQFNSYWVILVIPIIFFIIKVIKKEDSELLNKFGDEFIDYKKKVGIFPWFK